MQARLQELRVTIKAAAPGAQEGISYGMPYYEYKGRLVYFQLWKKHIGLYALVPIVEEYKSELQGYVTAKGTVRFPLDEQLPLALLEKLVQARARKNEEAERKRHVPEPHYQLLCSLPPSFIRVDRWMCLSLYQISVPKKIDTTRRRE